MVFSGLYPVVAEDYEELKTALEKLQVLNDSSFGYEPETSTALGFGFRCGFLGFLHGEIVQERLEREYDLDPSSRRPRRCATAWCRGGSARSLRDREPRRACPRTSEIEAIEEPVILATIHVPSEHLGSVVIAALPGAAGHPEGHGGPRRSRVQVPLRAAAQRGGDRLPRSSLKSATRGYGPSTTSSSGYQAGRTSSKLDILVNGDRVDALSLIVHRDNAQSRGARAGAQAQGVHPAPACSWWHPGRHRQPRPRSSPAPRSRRCGRTSPPSATAATSPASASCSRSRRRARSA